MNVLQLCERVADLKRMPNYLDSAKTVQDTDKVIRSQAIFMEENEHTKSSEGDEIQHLAQLKQETDQTLRSSI